MNVIIMAGGDGERWAGEAVPKHFVRIDGEALLHRTVRQFRDLGEILIVGPPNGDPRYTIDGCTTIKSQRRGPASLYELWSMTNPSDPGIWNMLGDTLVLLGDVFFSDAAVHAIKSLCLGDSFCWFGRMRGSTKHEKQTSEIFALAFSYLAQPRLYDACRWSLYEQRIGKAKYARGWEIYGHCTNGGREPGHWVDIDDETDDFDRPCELKSWLLAHRGQA